MQGNKIIHFSDPYYIMDEKMRTIYNHSILSLCRFKDICRWWQMEVGKGKAHMLINKTMECLNTIHHNQNKNIVQEIKHIEFPKLREIYLFANNIQSVEPISRVSMPALVKFILGNKNQISFIKSMRKCQWPILQALQIQGNNISDVQFLSSLNSQRINSIGIEDNGNSSQCQNVAFLVKLETRLIQTVWIIGDNRIKRESLNRRLKTRHNEIKIY